jgi:hypothetical protein
MKVWNGRGYCCRTSNDNRWDKISHNVSVHANVCAKSREDARRVIEEYTGTKPSVSELRDYWSPVWGYSMDGIEPVRGLWLEFDPGKPVKVI